MYARIALHSYVSDHSMSVSKKVKTENHEELKPDRKKNILLSAEKLFAMRSYDSVSIRDIANEAQVPSRLVGYYFGKKSDLFEAILEQRKENVIERRRLIKEAIQCISDADVLEKIVTAWCFPVVQMRADEHSENFLLLVARCVWEQSDITAQLIERYYDGLAMDFINALHVIFPTWDEPRRCWAYEWAVGAMLMLVADRRVERLSKGKCIPGDPAMLPELVAFICAGIRAMEQLARAKPQRLKNTSPTSKRKAAAHKK